MDVKRLGDQLHCPSEACDGCLVGGDCAEDLHGRADERSKELGRNGVAHVTQTEATNVLHKRHKMARLYTRHDEKMGYECI